MLPPMQQQPQGQPQPAPGAGPSPGPGGAPQSQDQGQMHPELAKNLDPNDPVQSALLQGFDQLSPQDVAVLKQNLSASPQLAQVLTKVAPCVGFVFKQLASGGGAPMPAAGEPGPAPMPQGGGAPPAPMPQPGGLQRPATALGRMQA